MSTQLGCAVFEADSGKLLAADAAFQMWLDGRGVDEVFPELLKAVRGGHSSGELRVTANNKAVTARVILLEGPDARWKLVQLASSHREASDAAYHDPVTQLPDRRALAEHRENWNHNGNNLPHAVLFMDLNNFKEVNDRFGHVHGDQVLSILAARWRKSLRERDLIVRYGGDEFVILLSGIRSLEEARPIIDRLKNATSLPVEIDGHSVALSVSIGAALAENTAQPLDELLTAADKAMYEAKRGKP